MSKKYGSIFTVYFGPKKVVVLAGYQTVKKALVNYAEEFGNRDINPIFFEFSKGYGKNVDIHYTIHCSDFLILLLRTLLLFALVICLLNNLENFAHFMDERKSPLSGCA